MDKKNQLQNICKIHVLLTVFLAAVFSSCNDAVDSPYEDVEFIQVSSMSETGRASAVGFAVNGKGYVALGRNGNGGLNDCWEYNPIINSWTRKSDFTGKARVNAVAVGLDTVAYVGLGFDLNHGFYDIQGLLRDFWCYHPSTDIWEQKDSFPSSRTNACISFYYNKDIYIGCGFYNGFSAEMWKYSIASDEWTQLKDFPGGYRACAVVSADEQHVYLGTGFNTANLNDWWEYFPEKDSWTHLKSMPDNGRQNGEGLAINERYFVSTGRHFGGTQTGGLLLDDLMEYDSSKNVWYVRGTVPGGGRTNAVSFVLNGKGYVGFGENDSNILNDFWCFEP